MAAEREVQEAKARRDSGRLIFLLQDSDREILLSSIRALGEILSAEAVPHLAPFLRHELAVVRAESLRSLSSIGTGAAYDAVSASLDGQEAWYKIDALRVLAASRVSGAVRRLVPLLRDRDGAVRKEAYQAARAMGPEALHEAAKIGRTDPDPWMRRAALEWVADLDDPETQLLYDQALSDRRPEIRKAAIEWISCRGDDRVSALVDALVDPAARARLERIDTVAGIASLFDRAGGTADAGTLLRGLLARRPAGEVVSIAARCRSKSAVFECASGHSDYREILAAAVSRGDAATALAALAHADVDLARAALRHADPSVRVCALGRLGPEDAARCVADPEEDVAWAAASVLLDHHALESADRPVLLRVLARVSGSPDVAGRRKAVEGLIRLGDPEPLAALADTHDRWVLPKIAFALEEAGDARALVPLVRVAEEIGGEPGRRARRRIRVPDLETLFVFLRHRRGSVRCFAAASLEGADDPRAVAPLLAAMDDESHEVQHAAVRALRKFAGRDDVADRFIACLGYGELSVREASIEALGEQKVLRAVPPLVRLLGHVFLKRKAMAALAQMGDRRAYLAVLRRKRRDEMIFRERERVRQKNEARYRKRHAQAG